MVTINIGQKEAIFFGVVILVFVVAGLAVAYGGTNPAVMGHSANELARCGANQVLKMDAAGTSWTCAADATGSGGKLGPNCTLIYSGALDGKNKWEAVDIPSFCQNGVCTYMFMSNNNVLVPPKPWVGIKTVYQYDQEDISAGYTVGMMGFEGGNDRDVRNGDTVTNKILFSSSGLDVVEDKWTSGAYVEYSKTQFSAYTPKNYYSRIWVCY